MQYWIRNIMNCYIDKNVSQNNIFWTSLISLIDVISQMLKNYVNHYWFIDVCNVVEMNKKLNARFFFVNINEEIKHFALFIVQLI